MTTQSKHNSHAISLLDGEVVEESEAYSREVLAATFNTHFDDLPSFPFTPADPLIVRRSNPVDPR